MLMTTNALDAEGPLSSSTDLFQGLMQHELMHEELRRVRSLSHMRQKNAQLWSAAVDHYMNELVTRHGIYSITSHCLTCGKKFKRKKKGKKKCGINSIK